MSEPSHFSENKTSTFAALRSWPEPIVSLQGMVADLQDGLLPEEAGFVACAVRQRAMQFEAGRSAARRALALLGVSRQPILRGARGEPVWPEGIVGSITHTSDIAAVAVASAAKYRGIGIDIESAAELSADLLPTIASAREIGRLSNVSGSTRLRAAKMLFCAKEAVYKCVWPLGREFFDFLDVEIELAGTLSAFRAVPRRRFSGAELLEQGVGQLTFDERTIAVAFLLANSTRDRQAGSLLIAPRVVV